MLVDWSGVFFAGPLTRWVRDNGLLPEGQLQTPQAVTKWCSVSRTHVSGTRNNESGKCGDELARLIKVNMVPGIRHVTQPNFDSSCCHQVDSRRGDNFGGGYFVDLADLILDVIQPECIYTVLGVIMWFSHTSKLGTTCVGKFQWDRIFVQRGDARPITPN